jgi:hypothetical protein
MSSESVGSSVDGGVSQNGETIEDSKRVSEAGYDHTDEGHGSDVARIAKEEREAPSTPDMNGTFHGYGKVERDDDSIQEGSEASMPQAINDTESVEGSVSIPDDTPSLPVGILKHFSKVD